MTNVAECTQSLGAASPPPPERSLDPADWAALHALGHRMVDDMLGHLAHLRDRPAWQPMPDTTRTHFQTPVPRTGLGGEAAYHEFLEHILPYPAGNIHPRFWGWVIGAGTPSGTLHELLTATMNTNAWGAAQASTAVESQVLDWFKDLFGFPAEASGLLTTGGSMATLIGLAVARQATSGYDPDQGWEPGAPRPRLYCSVETHNSVDKAAVLLGLGREAVRKIPVGPDYAIDLDALRAALDADHAAGDRPCCVIGTVGTVNTGGLDDIAALATLAREYGAWLHVDGAFGALAALAPEHAALRDVLALADSLSFDCHKWLSVPYDCGGILIRHPTPHQRAFAASAAYLAREERGLAAGTTWFNELGMELSRGFRALKVWLLIKEVGIDRLGEQIQQNLDQARRLAALISATPALTLMAPVTLNIVCFRATPAGYPEQALDRLNQEILRRLQERGIAVPSGTTLQGRFVLRVALVNHRTRHEDFLALLEAVHHLTAEILTAEAA